MRNTRGGNVMEYVALSYQELAYVIAALEDDIKAMEKEMKDNAHDGPLIRDMNDLLGPKKVLLNRLNKIWNEE